MTDDARRVLGQVDLARLFAARNKGDACVACGRPLADDEPIWVERVDVIDAGRRVASYRAPVGAECASAVFRTATATIEPDPCVTCGRGVYYGEGGPGRRRHRATCSKRCAARYQVTRAKEARGS